MAKLDRLVRVRRVESLEGFIVRIEFEDGTVKERDLSPLLQGAIFDELRQDQTLFRTVAVTHGTLTWANGADIDPDVLYYDLVPASVEAIEPSP